MKIISKTEFLKLPAGTVWSELGSDQHEGIFIKGKTIGDDFTFANLIGEIKTPEEIKDWGDYAEFFEQRINDGEFFDLVFDQYQRDGLFDIDAKYAIWSKKELEVLIKILENGLFFYQIHDQN